jgi:hypothetical protein
MSKAADRAQQRLEARIWVTKDGDEIPIKEMATGHVKNALAMLKRNGYIGPSTLEFYLTCSPPNGDMASYYFEQEMDEVFDRPVNKYVDLLEEELAKRGRRTG